VITVLEAELLAHLDAQLASAQHLLSLILAQGKAIRAREVDDVLAQLAAVQTEMGRRGQLEADRARLLQQAGAALGIPATQVTVETLCGLITPGAADAVRERSAHLRGLLAEIAREHGINRALMRQELAFLSHLTRMLGQPAQEGYRPDGSGPLTAGAPGSAPSAYSVLDLKA
jgi:hypothetical protein